MRRRERANWLASQDSSSLCTFSDADHGARGWPHHSGVRKPMISLVEKELLKQTSRGHPVFRLRESFGVWGPLSQEQTE
jgi:hypothetical protein